MTDGYSISDELRNEVYWLADSILHGPLTQQMAQSLEELIGENEAARRCYVEFLHDAYEIHRLAALEAAGGEPAAAPVMSGEWRLASSEWLEDGNQGVGDAAANPASDIPHTTFSNPEIPCLLSPPIPSFVFRPSLLATAYHGTANFFSQEIPFACLMSTLIVGFALVVASFITKEHYTQMPGRSVASAERSYAAPESDGADKAPAAVKVQEEVLQFVGQVTGMVDCRWAEPGRIFSGITDYSVALHDKYSLTSGLMEITYDTGTKVILQGPVTYEVESANGGYLSLGRLTARIEKKVASENTGKAVGTLAPSPQPLAPSPSALFAVRTPTAVVTDLGTEFGVEVERGGETLSHVFQGKVTIVTLDIDNPTRGKSVTLGENQSARTSHKEKMASILLVSGSNESENGGANRFVRANSLKDIPFKEFRRWQAFSEELRKRDDLLAYYDFQRDADDPRDENGCQIMRNRAKTGPKFDGRVFGMLRMGMARGRWPGKQALKFGNSDDDAVLVNIPIACKQMTLAAWVANDDIRSDEYASLLSSDGYLGQPGGCHWLIVPDGKDAMFCVGISPGAAIFTPPLLPRPTWGDGQWRHTAVAFDASSRRVTFYLNGRNVHEAEASHDLTAAFGQAQIGNWNPAERNETGHRLLRGKIDEFAIFTDALSDGEIERLYNDGKPDSPQNIARSNEPPGKETTNAE